MFSSVRAAPPRRRDSEGDDMTDQFFGWSGVMLVAAVLACDTSDSGFRGETAPEATSTPASAGDWRPLFNGKTTAGWRGYHQQTMPGGWQAVNGELTRVSQGGDIITVDQFDDRKSTRLNSSHLGISYAVFCLKKKN